jgi:hypothetical protein
MLARHGGSGGVHRRADVEATFGGDFLPAFRDEAGKCRLQREGEADHFLRDPHFQIQGRGVLRADGMGIAVLHVAAVATDVDGDGIRPSRDRIERRLQGRGFRIEGLVVARIPGLPEGGDVIDVDAEKHGKLLPMDEESGNVTPRERES